MEEKLTIVDAAARVEGKLTGKDARILGRFEGEIQLTGRLQIGDGAEVEARVRAEACEIGGRYRGQLEARSVVLLEKARVEGSLSSETLAVREGAQLDGEVSTGAGRSKPELVAKAGAA
jgi:cytoskeletal protein CcmA (bactofilin family)